MEETDDILKSFPKGDPFKAPEGFFEQFKDEVTAAAKNKVAASSFMSNLRSPLKLAAAFALLVVFSYLVILFVQYSKNPVLSEIPSGSDTLSYEYSFVDEYYTADVLTDTTTKDDIGKEEYVEFLMDNNVSYELLADYY